MAKRKKKGVTKRRTKSTRRRGRVSGIGALGLPVERIAALVVGGVASQALNGIAKNIKPLQNNAKILPAIKIVGGALLMSKTRNPMAQDFAAGIVGEGGLQLIRALAPNVFAGLTGESVGNALINLDDSVGATLIDLDEVNGVGASYIYAEDHQVGAVDDYAVNAI